MNDNQKNQEQNAAQPQQNAGDPKRSEQTQTTGQNAPSPEQPGGGSKSDHDASKPSSGNDNK